MAKSRRSEPVRHRATPAGPNDLDAITEVVTATARNVAASSDAELEDIDVKRAGAKLLVRVTVDLPEDQIGSMSLDHVAEVSRALADELDVADAIPGAYTLEVSTPGTSRALVDRRHFMRARTRLVQLVTTSGDTVTGRLREVSQSQLLLVDEDSNTHFALDLADVKHGKIEVELKRVASDDEAEVED